MRISDWSSDVCSSDLRAPATATVRAIDPSLCCRGTGWRAAVGSEGAALVPPAAVVAASAQGAAAASDRSHPGAQSAGRGGIADRKSAVWGKRESDRVDSGGRRISKKTTENNTT